MLTLDQVKKKSSSRLNGLHPAVLTAADYLIDRCYARNVPIVITQGLRTKAEQNALYAKSRTQEQLNAVGLSHVTAQPKEKWVTNAIGGTSYHNYGLAIDFALLLPDGKSVSWDMNRDGDSDKVKDWNEVVEEAKKLGFAWGGDFKSIFDGPHFEMTFGLSIANLKDGRTPAQAAVDAVYSKIKKLKEEDKVNKDVKVSVYVDGVKVSDGVLDTGVTYTPARAVAEALGATVAWDKENLRVDIKRGK